MSNISIALPTSRCFRQRPLWQTSRTLATFCELYFPRDQHASERIDLYGFLAILRRNINEEVVFHIKNRVRIRFTLRLHSYLYRII